VSIQFARAGTRDDPRALFLDSLAASTALASRMSLVAV
jgi:hypothetical protein